MDGKIEQSDSRIELFWQRYITICQTFRIPEKALPWYRRHVQAFIDQYPGIRLQSQSAENLQVWLEGLGRNEQLTGWQYRQKVDALRLLFCHMVRATWALEFDWDRWAMATQPLEQDHPTVARTFEMIEKAVKDPKNDLGKRFPEVYRKYLAAIRIPEYSINTEKSYLSWINRFLRFHNKTHPQDCAEPEVASFLEYLAVQRKVAGATQAQALNAIVFFFTKVLEKPLGNIGPFKRPKKPKRIPTVLNPDEIQRLFFQLHGMHSLLIRLMYSTGMRVMECVRLRILDLDFSYRQIIVRESKGKKDRVVPMPDVLLSLLQKQVKWVEQLHRKDLDTGFGTVFIPEALARKYPNAERELRWQYLFPASRLAQNPRSGIMHRHHIHQSAIQKAVKQAATKANILKRVTSYTMRHSFATHLLETGSDIRTVQELLGHANVETTMIYTHVMKRGGNGTRSPLDHLKFH